MEKATEVHQPSSSFVLYMCRESISSALMQMKADKIYMGALTPVVIERLHISTGPLNNFKSIVIPVTVITFVILSVYFILFLAK